MATLTVRSVDSSQVGVLERQRNRPVEAQVGLEVLSNLTDETLEGELPDEELSRLLVATNLTESDA